MSDKADKTPIVYIDTKDLLEDFLPKLQKAKVVALDTEADSLYCYQPKVCLIQVGLGEDSYIVDPLADICLDEFFTILKDKALIFHAADYDLRMLYLAFKFEPQGKIFDTMIAAQFLGYDKLGLAALVEYFFKVEMSKQGQKSNWSQRPLTEEQISYASDDTRYLKSLADRLKLELKEVQRSKWHEEACQRLVKLACQISEKNRREDWKIKGAGKLKARQLVFLKHLWQWREKQAERADLPPFKVMVPRQLLHLAMWGTDSTKKIKGQVTWKSLLGKQKLPSHCKGKRFEELIRALEDASKAPLIQEEPKERSAFKKKDADYEEKLEKLRKVMVKKAEELKVDPSFLASLTILKTIVREGSTVALDSLVASNHLMNWQKQLLKEPVQKILKG